MRTDTLVAEEPLEIRLGDKPLTITMRTPGDDFEPAAGFLVGEGVVARAEEVRAIAYCAAAADDDGNTYNIVDVPRPAGREADIAGPSRVLQGQRLGTLAFPGQSSP
ncbi:MAG: formate dehydrogenase accessory sulfurtransferase FdhD [Actinoallomurus sp.]